MTFPPIVERELRIAARRRSTFQVRFVGAILATLLGGLFLLASLIPGTSSGSGRTLFTVIVFAGFGGALLAGPMLTADSLSRERRQGTLGLLFLTDLSGLEVVGGKLAALSLIPLHGLLAALPIAGMSLFLGGVTGTEFGRAWGTLFNTLFLSMALGLWVSSWSSDGRQAFALTAGLLIALGGLPLLLEELPPVPGIGRLGEAATASVSPIQLLRCAMRREIAGAHSPFAGGLLAQHLLAWGFLGAAGVVVRRAWRDRDLEPTRSLGSPRRTQPGRLTRRHDGVRAARNRSRTEGHPTNPVGWLAWHNAWVRQGVWWVAGFTVAATLTVFAGSWISPTHPSSMSSADLRLLDLGLWLLKLLLVVHTTHFLQDACRDGTLEILLVTPASNRLLCDGHLAALRRIFGPPILVLGLLQFTLRVLGAVLRGGDWPSLGTLLFSAGLPAMLHFATHLLESLAVAYHATRWALCHDRPVKTIIHTVVVVLALPALFCFPGRAVADLLIIALNRPRLENFRDLVRRWFFPSPFGAGFGTPRLP